MVLQWPVLPVCGTSPPGHGREGGDSSGVTLVPAWDWDFLLVPSPPYISSGLPHLPHRH